MDRWPAAISPPTTHTGQPIEDTLSTEYEGGYEATRPGAPRDRMEFNATWKLLPIAEYYAMVEFFSSIRWSAYPFEWPYPLAGFGYTGYADPNYGDSGFGVDGFGEGLLYVVKLVPRSFQWAEVNAEWVDCSFRLREV